MAPLSLDLTLGLLDFGGVAVFAASGALAAARLRHDIITFAFFAAITGMGGGTLRDLLMGVPVFWTQKPAYALTCVGTAGLVWLIGPRQTRWHILEWLDAAGLAAYAVLGSAKALDHGFAASIAVIMGVMTASSGGILRDVLAQESNLLLKRDIYITAALLSAAAFVGLNQLGMGFWPDALLAFSLGLILRGGAILKGWTLPGFGRH